MILFLSGGVTLAFLIAGVFFLKFWRKTSDRFFLYFCIAFFLFGIGQFATSMIDPDVEWGRYVYLIRVVGFTLILFAIFLKNLEESSSNPKK